MEDRTVNGVESEDISESLLCCVCLELLYKPVVLFCGHISCFWCVHHSMNRWHESHCPICRNPYNHFPSVCQTLHFLLMKMYPITYRKREEHISMEERESRVFSPQYDTNEDWLCHHQGSLSDSSVAEHKGEQCEVEKLESISQVETDGAATSRQNCDGELKASSVGEKNLSCNKLNQICRQVSTADLLCLACKDLLFRPVVLNCGHAYCEACAINPINENEMLKCQICQSPDPRGFPKVCLVLDHFLDENFPKEYALRRDAIRLKQEPTRRTILSDEQEGSAACSSGDNLDYRQPYVHVNIGCDSCGVFPMIGDRYKCRDCAEKIGYDLCGDCYKRRSKIKGRFNQQHTEDHRLELVIYSL